MLRTLASVVAGYATMVVLVFVTFSGAFLILGTEGAFRPGSFDPSATWIAVSFVLGAVAAVTGGLVCATIARSPQAPWVLAGLVLVLGLMLAAAHLAGDDERPTVRSGELSNSEAMMQARQPLWAALVNPLIGAAGVLLGARLRRPAAG